MELTDQQVITECVKIAQKNGWSGKLKIKELHIDSRGGYHSYTKIAIRDVIDSINDTNSLIFDHDFCKALFGNDFICTKHGINHKQIECDKYLRELSWVYHIQQLALSSDRIDYLRKYLDERTKTN